MEMELGSRGLGIGGQELALRPPLTTPLDLTAQRELLERLYRSSAPVNGAQALKIVNWVQPLVRVGVTASLLFLGGDTADFRTSYPIRQALAQIDGRKAVDAFMDGLLENLKQQKPALEFFAKPTWQERMDALKGVKHALQVLMDSGKPEQAQQIINKILEDVKTAGGNLPKGMNSQQLAARIVYPGGAQTSSAQKENSCQPVQQFFNTLTEKEIEKKIQNAIPPKTYKLTTRAGVIEINQVIGKSGLTYKMSIATKDGSKINLGTISFNNGELQAKQNLSLSKTINLTLEKNKNISQIQLGLSVNPKGLGQLKLSLVGHDQSVQSFTLNPASCDFDSTSEKNLNMNGGVPDDAFLLAVQYLDRVQEINHGNIYPGLINLLLFIKPGPDGFYRNHGHDGLGVLTQALNVLKNSGVNFGPLEKIQEKISNIPRKPNGMPTDEQAYKELRSEAENWLRSNIQKGFDSGKISPDSLRNSYGINFGIKITGPTLPPKKQSMNGITFQKINIIQLQNEIAKEGWELRQSPNGQLQLKDTGPVNGNFDKIKGILAKGLGVDVKHLKVLSHGPVYKIEVRLPPPQKN